MSTAWLVALLAVGLIAIALCLAVSVRDRRRHQNERVQLHLLDIFGASIARVQDRPQELVSWVIAADAARTLFPKAFESLDAASGARFPYSAELVEGVHARWTSEWLGWEREHDVEFKRRADDVEREFGDVVGDAARPLRARLADIEQEKLLRYQERYEQYVRMGKALSDIRERTGSQPTAAP